MSNHQDRYRILTLSSYDENAPLEATFSGREVKLSELTTKFGPLSGNSCTVYADTIIIDTTTFNALTAVVVARRVKMEAGTKTVTLRKPPENDRSKARFLFKEIDGDLKLAVGPEGSGSLEPVTADPKGLRILGYEVEPSGSAALVSYETAAYFRDLIETPTGFNALQASFAAATRLVDSSSAADTKEAQSMLTWITEIIRLAEGDRPLPPEWFELKYQAAALLITFNIQDGARYVPVLSLDYYTHHVASLLNVLEKYEANIQSLNTTKDIASAVLMISGALKDVAHLEIKPLEVQLKHIESNLETLADSVISLKIDTLTQLRVIEPLYDELKGALRADHISAILKATMELVLAFVSISATLTEAGGSLKSLTNARNARNSALIHNGRTIGREGMTVQDLIPVPGIFKESVDATKKAADTFKNSTDFAAKIQVVTKLKEKTTDNALADSAVALIKSQQKLLEAFEAARQLWTSAKDNLLTGKLPDSLASPVADPAIAWDNFMVEAKTQLDQFTSGSAQGAAIRYKGGLQTLAQYGKALSAALVAWSGQLAEWAVVKAQVATAKKVGERWGQVNEVVTTEEEKRALLRGIVQGRADAIARSVRVAWSRYRDAYFYLHFQNPAQALELDSGAAKLREKFEAARSWIVSQQDTGPTGAKAKLFNQRARITLRFPVVATTEGNGSGGVVRTRGAEDARDTLTWSIQPGDEQLSDLLPKNGDIPIWIEEAKFFLEGVTPNKRGMVIAEVATSGIYQNGYGSARSHHFVNQGLIGDYGYNTALDESKSVYIPWTLAEMPYALPTLFTQWTMTLGKNGGDASSATNLRMELKLVFRN